MKIISLIFIILISTLFIPANFGQEHQQWTHPAYDEWNSGHNPQNIINRDNVDNLELKWMYNFRIPPSFFVDYEDGIVPPEGIQTTPLVYNGIVYVASGYNELIAIEASSGRELWTFSPDISQYNTDSWAKRLATRSLTIHENAIYYQTSECSIYGLDLYDGKIVFHLPNTCDNIPGTSGKYFGTFSPIFYDNLIITRAQGNAFGGRGFVSAYDLDTKELVWQWFSVPPEGGQTNWGKQDASKGNIEFYPDDWGYTDLIAGGTSWGLIAIDRDSGLLYLLAGEPSNQFDASLRPGPNLFSNSIIALNPLSGELVWYYQFSTHDVNNHDAGWKVILGNVDFDMGSKKVIMAASKSNDLYVLDALTGDPIYDHIHFGPPNYNTLNDNTGSDSDMEASQLKYLDEKFCPSHLGGVFAGPAFFDNVIFIPSQNICGSVFERKIFYKDEIIDGYVYRLDFSQITNGSVYAIDVSNRELKWQLDIPNRIQSAALVVSGDTLFLMDRSGTLHYIDSENGNVISSISFHALGSAGVSIGADSYGEMTLFVPVGGSQLFGTRSGSLLAFGISDNTENTSNLQSLRNTQTLFVIAIFVSVISLIFALVTRRIIR
jgi:alcohol dehydrogenase (cytochrome c)